MALGYCRVCSCFISMVSSFLESRYNDDDSAFASEETTEVSSAIHLSNQVSC